jgi:hypothetical protein
VFANRRFRGGSTTRKSVFAGARALASAILPCHFRPCEVREFPRRFISTIPAQVGWRHVHHSGRATFEPGKGYATHRGLPAGALLVPVHCDEALGRE